MAFGLGYYRGDYTGIRALLDEEKMQNQRTLKDNTEAAIRSFRGAQK